MTAALQIPPLPAAHARALALLMERDVGLAEVVAAIIEPDPGLTAAVLRAANSAESAPVDRITRAGDAIVRLGARTARALVIASMLRGRMERLSTAKLDLEELWRHLIGVGLIADASLSVARGDARVPAFTAGLLHDVGRIALAASQPPHYARIARLVREGRDAREAERHVLGVDHEQFGAEVAAHWGLPSEIAEAVTGHHEPGAGETARHVAVARRIAGRLSIGDGLHFADDPRLTALGSEEDRLILATLGGPQALQRRIAWFRGAIG
ncbi:MAG: HDOD domain-containing protein [Dehalococcoidia bacterium]